MKSDAKQIDHAHAFVQAQADAIRVTLRNWLDEVATDLGCVGTFGVDVCRRLGDYSARGKMIRGALVVLGYRLGGGDDIPIALQGAAAIELLQSFLLIHDDIMDDDSMRRGMEAMHLQYAHARPLGHGAPEQLGRALAICAGDIAMLLSSELLTGAGAHLRADAQTRLMRLYAREVARVGVAQMDDVAYSFDMAEPDEEAIMALYRYKTGRYSFVLPLHIGVLLADSGGKQAHQTDRMLETLSIVGEALGIIFQIRDDHIELFGQQRNIGKPVGSDISSDKKTLYRRLLFDAVREQARPAEQERLAALFGAADISAADLDYIRMLIRRYGIQERIDTIVAQHTRAARDGIATLPMGAPRDTLYALLAYNSKRER